MEKLIIKEALPEDAERLIEYTKQIGGETDNLSFDGRGLAVSVEEESEFLKKLDKDNKSAMFLAWREDKIVGNGSLIPYSGRMGHRAELGLTVIKEQWKQGIGSLILEKLIEHAKIKGIEIINLEVRSDNIGAIALYKKFGFQKIGRSPAFFKIGKEYIDFDLMFLDVRK